MRYLATLFLGVFLIAQGCFSQASAAQGDLILEQTNSTFWGGIVLANKTIAGGQAWAAGGSHTANVGDVGMLGPNATLTLPTGASWGGQVSIHMDGTSTNYWSMNGSTVKAPTGEYVCNGTNQELRLNRDLGVKFTKGGGDLWGCSPAD